MKRILPFAVAAALTVQTAVAAGEPTATLPVKDYTVTVDEARATVRVKIDFDMASCHPGRDAELVYTPVLMAAGATDSLELEPVTVAGRSRWYSYLRQGFLDGGDARIYRAGKDVKAVADFETALLPWMSACTLEMRLEKASCCNAPVVEPGPSEHGMVPMARISLVRPALDVPYVFAPPVEDGPVIKKIEGSAFVTFVVNRTELRPDYMNNRAELAKIVNSIEYVRRDSDATITGVHIKGFASPEGPYDNNVRLAQGRTETLRRYVRDLYHFADSTVGSSYEPEDWAGLRAYVADSMSLPIENRGEILAIIDGPLGFDNKNLAIQTRFPADYAVLLRQVYPWLRHSDYRVTYAIRTYTDIAEIRRVFAADPSRLRNVDFYTLAQTYPVGSPEYRRVFETAVEVYPDDPMLNLNAANIELERGKLDRAQSYLLKAGNTPQANYARGILAARRGDYTEALRRFESAQAQGLPEAAQAISQTRALANFHAVEYLYGK